ncbi:NAD(P)/FAD-dependent oxidoreductase [Herbiconiux sp. CPCC 203407]|uniref:NAD(P)/FAD-dependent oxidoreductase n=1 Tax=Herbiconiux oxytropis TaxID=2970915 RepID=A0AA42BVI8_9MICO|nr:NAD(P)/FAD-dependent oxidoreductase [Herbiconiux oxytropis]MCS5724214.1 NAD(P)/FAD-dependent oxidoreductase [Herbiconiux oxytropis]MCS5727311.1 NAD(P)/FAD-dependent oxidoreductase [Herbiconiux oxytropis]
MNEDTYDVIIVGGGAAGLNAALVLTRARRRVLVVDAGAPRNRFAAHMHGFLTRDGFSPLELLALGRAEVRGYGGEILAGRAVSATGEAGAFEVTVELAEPDATRTTGGTATFTARRLVIASGLRDELPTIPGLAEQWGTGAIACPYCDGWEARDLRLGVIATGPMSIHQATLVRQWSADVTFVGPLTDDLDPAVREGLEARGVRIIATEISSVLSSADGTLTGVALADGTTLDLDRLFVGPRLQANDELLRQLGAETAEGPMGAWTASDFTGLTSVPGVWVAGNSGNAGALVVVAAGMGAMAGAALNADLVAAETRAAVEAARAGSTRTPV